MQEIIEKNARNYSFLSKYSHSALKLLQTNEEKQYMTSEQKRTLILFN